MNVTVKIEGKGIADLFAMRCVRSIEKLRDGKLMVTVQSPRHGQRAAAYIGDKITYDTDIPEYGKVMRNDKNKNIRL